MFALALIYCRGIQTGSFIIYTNFRSVYPSDLSFLPAGRAAREPGMSIGIGKEIGLMYFYKKYANALLARHGLALRH
jgi:hypothetical protein